MFEPAHDLTHLSVWVAPTVQCQRCLNVLEFESSPRLDAAGWHIIVRHPEQDFTKGLVLPGTCPYSARRYRWPLAHEILPELP